MKYIIYFGNFDVEFVGYGDYDNFEEMIKIAYEIGQVTCDRIYRIEKVGEV